MDGADLEGIAPLGDQSADQDGRSREGNSGQGQSSLHCQLLAGFARRAWSEYAAVPA
jgi:hypothetical protein